MWNVKELSPVDTETLKKYASEARGRMYRASLHWTAGRYGQIYPDYHVSIDCDGRIYMPATDLTQYRMHIWQRNTGNIGIAMCGCYDAQANSGYNMTYGSNPVTTAQIEAMAIIVAILVKYAGIPLDNILTHQEYATIDGYGPGSGDQDTRWDLWFLPDTDGKLKPGGDVIRGKAAWYLRNYNI